MDVVWLKRDVRLGDHEPLSLAVSSGRRFMLLYMYEPHQLFHETAHGSHIAFINEGLLELDGRLRKTLGRSNACITTRRGNAVDILASLHSELQIARLLSHQEVGHSASYERDKQVATWCRENNIAWFETPQDMVVRGLSLRDPSSQARCKQQADVFLMRQPIENPFGSTHDAVKKSALLVCKASQGFLTAAQLGLRPEVLCDRLERQRGGELLALELLNTFLAFHCGSMQNIDFPTSGPVASESSAQKLCSRLSPYFAWGQISVRTVVHGVKLTQARASGMWARSLEAYLGRLEFRRVRMQEFEMRCWMEHRSVCEPWGNLRKGRTIMFGDPKLLGGATEQQRIDAFEQGTTGYPMVDACMRCLLCTGFLNFRMRGMLVSFAIFNLWLDWRAIKDHLARCFLDYEPGILYSQLQHHAGTFGEMFCCYNVTKQAKDQDPHAIFIRKYIPELSEVPDAYVHEPWKLREGLAYHFTKRRRVGSSYPMPVVNDKLTAPAAKKVIAGTRIAGTRKKACGVNRQEDNLEKRPRNESVGVASQAAALNIKRAPDTIIQLDGDSGDEKNCVAYEAEDTQLKEALRLSLATNHAEDAQLKEAIRLSLVSGEHGMENVPRREPMDASLVGDVVTIA